MKKLTVNIIVVIVALVLLIYPIYILILNDGFLSWSTSTSDYKAMMLEIIIWFFISLIGLKKGNVLFLIIESILFCYLHVMFFPVFCALCYVIGTVLLGAHVNEKIINYKGEGENYINLLLGMMILTVLFAVLSLFKYGNILNTRLLTIAIMLAVFVKCIYLQRKTLLKKIQYINKNVFTVSSTKYILFSGIMIFCMLQIGRANISLDYDSAWYGLRSEYVLANSTGIYENLGLTAIVHSYSKGFEIYCLPLSGLESYGFNYAITILFAIIILYVCYSICRLFLNDRQSLLGALLLSSIPGVMNMSITAKADILTVLVQLIMIYFSLLYFSNRESIYSGMVLVGWMYSQTLKSTAIVFSSSIVFAFLFCCLMFSKKVSHTFKMSYIYIITIVDVILVWYRTYVLTGVPANSLWAKLFVLLGLEYKYPYTGSIGWFDITALQNHEGRLAIVRRIFEFFLGPNSMDTDHVIIAWGTTLCTFLFFLVFGVLLFNLYKFYKMKSSPDIFMCVLFVGEFIGCVLSLIVLKKPDGNYFQLFYCITIIVGVIYIFKIVIQYKIIEKFLIQGILTSFIVINILLTGAVNWSWTSSFTPIDFINRGYYNHEKEIKRKFYDNGCPQIYSIVSEKSNNKVFAFGPHPDVLLFPCIVESEMDVAHFGNADLVSSCENFVELIRFCEYDYIFIWSDYIQKDTQSYQNVCSLFDENMCSEVFEENGNILIKLSDDQNCSDIKLKQSFLQALGY